MTQSPRGEGKDVEIQEEIPSSSTGEGQGGGENGIFSHLPGAGERGGEGVGAHGVRPYRMCHVKYCRGSPPWQPLSRDDQAKRVMVALAVHHVGARCRAPETPGKIKAVGADRRVAHWARMRPR